MNRHLFGTDGVRGLANQAPMDPETALALGRAIAYVFKGRGGRHHRIVIGKDTRLSGYMIENALSAGICSMGGEAIFLGPLPTPGIAFITRAMRADAGVVISASHNPYFDNGIKFFDHEGYKLPDEIELKMEQLVHQGLKGEGSTHGGVGRAYRVDDATGRYIEYLKATFPDDLTLDGVKIAVDCANGAAYRIAPMLFEELGAEVQATGIHPDGVNINEKCGALHPEALRSLVKTEGAQLGVALDGDADRLVLIDEQGEIVHGDALIALLASDLMEQGTLPKSAVVVTVMSNIGLVLALKEKGINVIRVPVGDRYVIEALRREGLSFGGEQSGHLIFLKHSTTGDGLIAALQVVALLKRRGRSLSELLKGIEIFPQILLNVKVRDRKELEGISELSALQEKIQKNLGKRGRLLLRYSGTEPVLRIMVEGEDPKLIRDYAEELKHVAETALGKG